MEHGSTPPPGFKLNNIALVSTLRAQIYEFNTEEKSGVILQFPPPQAPWGLPINPVVTTIFQYYDHSFGRQ